MEADRATRLATDILRLQPDINETAKMLGARLLHLSDVVQRHYGAICDEFGVSLVGYSVLTTLRRHAPRALTLTEINQEALITSGGMTFVVRQLEGQELVARRGHPKDGRSFLLRLTPKGRRLADRLIRAVADTDGVIAAHLGRRSSQMAIGLLRRLDEGVDLSDVERSFSR